MIFNATSGSNPLNFKVVASATEPSNPQENTIWVQTDVTMYGVSFGAETSPGWSSVAGQIFISYEPVYGSGQVSTTNSALTYLRKNRMNIYGKLTAARVCLTGAKDSWKLANAYIYKSGGWVQFSSEFAATIAVTYPSGSTLTCSNGSTTLTATTTTGSYTFTVPNTGTWTVKAVSGSNTASESVSITTDGQSASVTLTFFDGYLFNYGSKNEDVTGGWTTNNVPHASGFGDYPTVTTQSDGSVLIAMSNTGKAGMYITKNKIDLTDFSTITFYGYTYDYNGYGRCVLQVMSAIGSVSTDNVVASFYQNSRTVGEHTIDVSSLTGSYYIGFKIIFDAEVKMCSLKLS